MSKRLKLDNDNQEQDDDDDDDDDDDGEPIIRSPFQDFPRSSQQNTSLFPNCNFLGQSFCQDFDDANLCALYLSIPRFVLPLSREMIMMDMLSIFDTTDTMQLLKENPSRIAVTTEMWTCSYDQDTKYMSVTAHFISDSWILQSELMRFIHLPSPKLVESVSETLVQCLSDWEIDRKLSTMTIDKCTTEEDGDGDVMIRNLLDKLCCSSLLLGGELFRMGCFAHISALIVKDWLEVIGKSVDRIRDSVNFWTKTPKRVKRFDEIARISKVVSSEKLVLGYSDDWSTMYSMLSTALIYKDVFPILRQLGSLYRLSTAFITKADWELAKEMCDNLKLFYDVFEMSSGKKYATTSQFFPTLCEIRLLMSKWLTSRYDEIKSIASNVVAKFEKYWNVINGMMAVATVLDPRFKMKVLEFYFPHIYGDDSSFEMEKVRRLCYGLVKEYQLNSKTGKAPCDCIDSSCSPSSMSISKDKVDDHLPNSDLFASSTISAENVKSELDKCLEETVSPRITDFDLLGWWKTNALKYPTLHDIARDVLAIPITTVPSEHAFRIGDRLLTPVRRKLQSQTMEALMCGKRWLWAELLQDSGGTASENNENTDKDE